MESRDPKKFKEYSRRNARLSELGYQSYAEYLESDDWKRIRAKKLERHKHCVVCDRPPTQVHHLDYSHRVLLGLFNELLVTLCDVCHHRIEFDGKEKRSLEEANAELERLALLAGKERWVKMVRKSRAWLHRKSGRGDGSTKVKVEQKCSECKGPGPGKEGVCKRCRRSCWWLT